MDRLTTTPARFHSPEANTEVRVRKIPEAREGKKLAGIKP